LERFRGSQKEDERGPFSIQSSLLSIKEVVFAVDITELKKIAPSKEFILLHLLEYKQAAVAWTKFFCVTVYRNKNSLIQFSQLVLCETQHEKAELYSGIVDTGLQ
jgi:hypothetical protein